MNDLLTQLLLPKKKKLHLCKTPLLLTELGSEAMFVS